MQAIYYKKQESKPSSRPADKDNSAEYRKEKNKPEEVLVQGSNASENKRLLELLKFDENSLLQGIILSEILERPKSRRNRRNRRSFNAQGEE